MIGIKVELQVLISCNNVYPSGYRDCFRRQINSDVLLVKEHISNYKDSEQTQTHILHLTYLF